MKTNISNKTKCMNIVSNVFHVIGQLGYIILLVVILYFTIKQDKNKLDYRCFMFFVFLVILSIGLLMKFITIGNKLVWQVIAIPIIITICLIIFTDQLLKSTILQSMKLSIIYEFNKRSLIINKIIITFISIILLFIMLYIMYLYYKKQNKELRTHVHEYFVVSNLILIVINFALCVRICSIPKEEWINIEKFCKIYLDSKSKKNESKSRFTSS